MRQNRKTRCQICGDVSKGVYYTATSCKSCMDFFRRCVIYKKQYKVNIKFHKDRTSMFWRTPKLRKLRKKLTTNFWPRFKNWNRYENLRKETHNNRFENDSILNFWFASFSSETMTLMTLQAFEHFWNSVFLTLIVSSWYHMRALSYLTMRWEYIQCYFSKISNSMHFDLCIF